MIEGYDKKIELRMIGYIRRITAKKLPGSSHWAYEIETGRHGEFEVVENGELRTEPIIEENSLNSGEGDAAE